MNGVNGGVYNPLYINEIAKVVAKGSFPSRPYGVALHKLVEALVRPREERVVEQGPVASFVLQSGHVIHPALAYDKTTRVEHFYNQIEHFTLGLKGTPFEDFILLANGTPLKEHDVRIKSLVTYDKEKKELPLVITLIRRPFKDEPTQTSTLQRISGKNLTKDQLERVVEITQSFQNKNSRLGILPSVMSRYAEYGDLSKVREISLLLKNDFYQEKAFYAYFYKITTVEHCLLACKIIDFISNVDLKDMLFITLLNKYIPLETDREALEKFVHERIKGEFRINLGLRIISRDYRNLSNS